MIITIYFNKITIAFDFRNHIKDFNPAFTRTSDKTRCSRRFDQFYAKAEIPRSGVWSAVPVYCLLVKKERKTKPYHTISL